MSIILIKGPPKSGKSTLANALRNYQIANGRGALMVDEAGDADPKALLEKIISAAQLPAGADVKAVPWKPNSAVILVGGQDKLLATFEKLVPGFTAYFAPIYTVSTGVQSGPAA